MRALNGNSRKSTNLDGIVELVYNCEGGFLHPDSNHLASRLRSYRGFKGIGKYDSSDRFFTVIVNVEKDRVNAEKIHGAIMDYLKRERKVSQVYAHSNSLTDSEVNF